MMAVKDALEAAGAPGQRRRARDGADHALAVTVEDAKKVLRLVDRLEESDDIQTVYHTMELTDEIAAALEE